ncbi:MAG: hypothetical protein KDD70_16360, partial [Bdellovibrionales bacterium]|nr:hypothetical protein [Bdellovibrionales bacterium]
FKTKDDVRKVQVSANGRPFGILAGTSILQIENLSGIAQKIGELTLSDGQPQEESPLSNRGNAFVPHVVLLERVSIGHWDSFPEVPKGR